jgi:hypothetical protein
MTKLFARGDAWIGRKLSAAADETVRVKRGSVVLCDAWQAVPGTTQIEGVADGEIIVVGSRRDWIGDPTDWRLEDEQTTPQRGDVIEWAVGSNVLVFECQPATGDDVWEPHGRFDSRIRVHTKLIDRRSNE